MQHYAGALHLYYVAVIKDVTQMLMKQRFQNWFDWLIGGILSLLGFSVTSCEDPKTIMCEYGCPNADYQVIGSVKDESGNPLKGIQVVTQDVQGEGVSEFKDTVYTDASGKFATRTRNAFPGVQNVNVVFNDVDGPDNGGDFSSMSIEKAEYEKTKDGSGSWYDGAYTATVNAVMKKKSAE